MMALIYRFFTGLMQIILPLADLFVKRGKFKEFVQAQKDGIPESPLQKSGKRYWFHCASLGEFEQVRPMMEKLKIEDHTNSIVVSFFSPSGYRQKYDYERADAVVYLPLDTASNARKFQNYLQVDVAIFVKYEIWYFHLSELFKRNIPVYLVSAVFREKQFLFSFFGKFLFRLLPQFKRIFLQDQNSLHLLQKQGLQNAIHSGDTRYDRVKENALNVKMNERIASFKGQKQVIILGSSWPAEEEILLRFMASEAGKKYSYLIAPHDISEPHISEIQNRFQEYHPVLYTGTEDPQNKQVLILNTIGHLASAYFYADMAFIGGGFGKGLHNILEALAFGVPVVFGPNIQKYPEASLAMEYEVARIINGAEELEHTVAFWLKTEDILLTRAKCIDFINWHSGATDLVLKSISEK